MNIYLTLLAREKCCGESVEITKNTVKDKSCNKMDGFEFEPFKIGEKGKKSWMQIRTGKCSKCGKIFLRSFEYIDNLQMYHVSE